MLNIDEKNAGSHPRGFVKRYFAEGVVNVFFDTRFALANPQTEPARVLLEFLDTRRPDVAADHAAAGALAHAR